MMLALDVRAGEVGVQITAFSCNLMDNESLGGSKT